MVNMNDTEFIRDNVYYLRKHIMGMSQEAFAEKVDLSKDTISNIERGKVIPNITTLVGISNATETPITFFLSKIEDENIKTL